MTNPNPRKGFVNLPRGRVSPDPLPSPPTGAFKMIVTLSWLNQHEYLVDNYSQVEEILTKVLNWQPPFVWTGHPDRATLNRTSNPHEPITCVLLRRD